MKKIVALLVLMMFVGVSFAQQDAKQLYKERKEIQKLGKKELKERVSRPVRKQAKQLSKDGWKVVPGALPIDKQLERSQLMQNEFDETLFPKYVIANAQSVGGNYDAAKTAATSLAITNLAGQIQTEVSALVENTVGNQQLSAADAASITKSVMSSKNVIAQSIGRTLVIFECYRELPTKNVEVTVTIAYDGKRAKEAAKEAVLKSLEEKGEDLHQQLDNLLGF
ncbi:MAG: hypothetical protein KBT04_02490 [Bacteroidales bacterium]|nr:hypothetical protein [Candidatus Colimorpha onthohippi]